MKKRLFIIVTILVTMALFTQTAFAFSSTSVSTSQSWSYINTETNYFSTGSYTRQKEVLYNYKGSSSHYSVSKPCSANYPHVSGASDLHASQIIAQTWQITTSLSGKAGDLGASLGFAYSITSSMSVTSDIPKDLPSGYYYFGVKFRQRDFQVSDHDYNQEYINGSWKDLLHQSYTYYGTRLDWTGSGSTPIYYDWYKA